MLVTGSRCHIPPTQSPMKRAEFEFSIGVVIALALPTGRRLTTPVSLNNGG
jgi:hypothetical protein